MIAYGLTDKGKVRPANQDAFLVHVDAGSKNAVLALCDGMGGEKAGEIASSIAADAFMEYALRELAMQDAPLAVDIAREAAVYANLKVYDRSCRDEACRGMGTTLVAAVIREDDAAIVNVGDSRCYWMAEGQVQQVTRDHSWVQELVDQGVLTEDEARSHPRKNLITQAIGLQRALRSDVFRLDLQRGDRLLLCSDGLSNPVSGSEIGEILLREEDLSDTCGALLRLALDRGAPDNVTVLVLQR